MILITGKSTLAFALAESFIDRECVIVGNPEYDFSLQNDCDELVSSFPNPSIIINTFGTMTADCWQSMVTNFVAPAYLTSKYYEILDHGQIINISSASSWWSSYPNIPLNRLFYGISKFNLSEFGRQFNRANDFKKDVTITTIEPGKFVSPMSNYTGMDVKPIVDLIHFAISSKAHHLSLVK